MEYEADPEVTGLYHEMGGVAGSWLIYKERTRTGSQTNEIYIHGHNPLEYGCNGMGRRTGPERITAVSTLNQERMSQADKLP